MIIDGHAHLWQPSRGFDIRPIREHAEFQRDFLLPELMECCRPFDIFHVVITQSAPQIEETKFLLRLCRSELFVVGVTGWVDLSAADVAETLDRCMAEPKFVGVRAQLRRMPDGYIARPEVRRGVRALVQRGLSAVLLAQARHAGDCLHLLQSEPELRAILNHGGMPDLVSGDMAQWRRMVTTFARQTHAVAQLSGFVALAGPAWTPPLLELVIGHLLDQFGPDRLMFTSDWPMTDLYASYARWWEVFNTIIDHVGLSSAERSQIFGGVARRVHRLDLPGRLPMV
ncbi:MAG: amidohydrolase family protein [Variovorax sp.]